MPSQLALARRARAATLRRDVNLYHGLAARVGLGPTPFMLPFMGLEAEHLAERRASDAACWRGFRDEVTRLHPSLPAWTLATAPDGQILSSVVERLAYEALRQRLPPSVTLTVHPVITPDRKWTADFALVGSRPEDVTYVEVAGLLASDWRPRTEREVGYKMHFTAKLTAYAEAGLLHPAIIHVDQVCDPHRLRLAVDAVLADFGGLVA